MHTQNVFTPYTSDFLTIKSKSSYNFSFDLATQFID